MELTRNFHHLTKGDVALAGGKGASLGEMTQAGIPVPPGFVVLAGSFEQFIKEAGIAAAIEAILEKVSHKDINSVETASEEIRAIIKNAQFPQDIAAKITADFHQLKAEFVAVRSSATAEDSSSASWAGELESYLNVTEKNLLDSVKKCWSSLFTPRAIFYRFEKGLHKTKVSVAVVVQKMVQSDVSGITFTVHPVTQDYDQMVIEAGWGLGEAIVGGKVTPDTYVIAKSRLAPPTGEQNPAEIIIEKYISEQSMMITQSESGTHETDVADSKKEIQKLKDDKIIKLAELCHKIEQHYNYPQDIEWAMEAGELFITQSRPITTLT